MYRTLLLHRVRTEDSPWFRSVSHHWWPWQEQLSGAVGKNAGEDAKNVSGRTSLWSQRDDFSQDEEYFSKFVF